MFHVGAASTDMTFSRLGLVMLGYGNPKNFIEEVETPLTARAIVFEAKHSGEKPDRLVYINCEICFISQSLRDLVFEKLLAHFGKDFIGEQDLHISAQHTHSAGGGFTHYALYNLPTPGFCPEVLEHYAEASVQAVAKAYKSKKESELRYVEGEFEEKVPVAFNRSFDAFKRNHEFRKRNLRLEDQHLFIDRKMRGIKILDKTSKKPKAFLNWFGVHCTSITWRNRKISPDNKGYASIELEEKYRNESSQFVGIFAQGVAGDVSPLYQVPKWRRYFPKKTDEFKEARQNGHYQYQKASELVSSKGQIVKGRIRNYLRYYDLGKVEIDKDLLADYKMKRAFTSPACIGVAFLKGAENAGIDWPLEIITIFLVRIVNYWERFKAIFSSKKVKVAIKKKYEAQLPKHIFVESGEKRVLGTTQIKDLVLPGFIDPTLTYFKKLCRINALDENSWTQQVLPFQINLIGHLAILSFPSELTTMAGKRLKKMCTPLLAPLGIEHVIIAPYSNGYSGYVTTPEEYEAQLYEGGHCVFGKWTFLAYVTIIRKLINEIVTRPDGPWEIGLTPPSFSNEELSKRMFEAHSYS